MRQIDANLVLTKEQELEVLKSFIKFNLQRVKRVFENEREYRYWWAKDLCVESWGHDRGETLFEIPVVLMMHPSYHQVKGIIKALENSE